MIKLGLLKLIGLSEDQHSEFLFNSGIRYAEEFYHDADKDTLLLITGCRAYWDWYRNQFMQKDIEFVALHKNTRTSEKQLQVQWMACHEPERMTAHPGSDIAYKALQPVWDEAIKYKSIKTKSSNEQ